MMEKVEEAEKEEEEVMVSDLYRAILQSLQPLKSVDSERISTLFVADFRSTVRPHNNREETDTEHCDVFGVRTSARHRTKLLTSLPL